MSSGVLAMLLGLFVVPAGLLWAGHHWRKRSQRVRGAFWGGVVGHTLAAVISTVTALYRPVHWSDSDVFRGLLGFWFMLLLGAIGAALGYWLGGREQRP